VMISRFAKTFVAIIVAMFLLGSISFVHPPTRSYIDPWTGQLFGEGGVEQYWQVHPSPDVVKGGVIMTKLGNSTAKAELGRATWKLLHTMTLRYPEKPTQDERDAFNSYLHLLSRLYPCGECATEFQVLLKKYPPQTASRRSAALWMCSVHNEVNARLGKPEFDCANLDSTYDCGCGDAPISSTDVDDFERDLSKDDITGAKLIKGGR